jgi:hypothetical protein
VMKEQITDNETGIHLKGVLLHGSKRRRAEHHKYVTYKHDTTAVENETVIAYSVSPTEISYRERAPVQRETFHKFNA